MTDTPRFDPETDLDNTHSSIPFKNGAFGTCAHKNEDGYLSVEIDEAGRVATVTRGPRVDPKTGLFDSYGVDFLYCGLNDQIIADFPTILTGSEGWVQHHADKRLNGDTYVLYRAEDDTYLSHENGVDQWVEVEKDQHGNAKVPESCWLSKEERDLYLPLEEGVEAKDYSYLELNIIGMREEEDGSEMNAEAVDQPAQWVTQDVVVTYASGFHPPNPNGDNDVIYESSVRHRTAETCQAELKKICDTFAHFGRAEQWQAHYEDFLDEIASSEMPRP